MQYLAQKTQNEYIQNKHHNTGN